MNWIATALILLSIFLAQNHIKHKLDKIAKDVEAIKVVVYKDIKLKQ